MRYKRTNRKKEPEQVLATGTLTKKVPGTVSDPEDLQPGTDVQVSRVIKTPVGLRFRLTNSIRWVGEDSINIKYDDNLVVDYTKHLQNPVNTEKFTKSTGKSVKGLKTSKGFGTKESVSTKQQSANGGKGRKVMDKKLLKEAITSLNKGDKVRVSFLDRVPSDNRFDDVRNLAGKTGEFELVEMKKGRGKGGSQLMVLKAEDGGQVVTGTPHSEVILHVVTPDGKLWGFETADEVPKTFETNSGRASELKAQFKDLVGTTGARVRVESTEDEFSGEFTVKSAEQLRGRHGQVRLTLETGSGSELKLWSYRHSGIVTKFEVLSVSEQNKTETESA